MSLGIAVPYITINDLNSVLENAAQEMIIEKKTADALMCLTLDYRQEIIRKAQEQKDINDLRNQCRTVVSTIYRTKHRDNEVRRNIICKDHEANLRIAAIDHDARCKQMKREYLEEMESLQNSVDNLRAIIREYSPESEASKKAHDIIDDKTARIRELKRYRQELLQKEMEDYSQVLAILKQKHAHALCDNSIAQRDALLDREEKKNMVRDASPEFLPALLESLQSELDECLKGGEL